MAITGRDGSTLCVGDTVTLTCTLNTTSHRWRIPTVGLDTLITRSMQNSFGNTTKIGINIMTTADDGSQITTALSLALDYEFNGMIVSCSDGNQILNEVQKTTIMLFGELN